MRRALFCLPALFWLCLAAPAQGETNAVGAADANAATGQEQPASRPASRFQGIAPSGVGNAPPGAQFGDPATDSARPAAPAAPQGRRGKAIYGDIIIHR